MQLGPHTTLPPDMIPPLPVPALLSHNVAGAGAGDGAGAGGVTGVATTT